MFITYKNRIILLFAILLLAIFISSCPERIIEDGQFHSEDDTSEFPGSELVQEKKGIKAEELRELSYLMNKYVSMDQELTYNERKTLSKIMFKVIFATQLVEQDSSRYYRVPGYQWPKITAIKTFSAVLFFVALTIGIVSYFIGHNAGGKVNKGQIFFAIGIATAVGILGRSITIFIKITIYKYLSQFFDAIIVASVVEFISYTLWTIFLTGISVYLYETFTVTAKEIYQGG